MPAKEPLLTRVMQQFDDRAKALLVEIDRNVELMGEMPPVEQPKRRPMPAPLVTGGPFLKSITGEGD